MQEGGVWGGVELFHFSFPFDSVAFLFLSPLLWNLEPFSSYDDGNHGHVLLLTLLSILGMKSLALLSDLSLGPSKPSLDSGRSNDTLILVSGLPLSSLPFPLRVRVSIGNKKNMI